jgi:hypothetical protein
LKENSPKLRAIEGQLANQREAISHILEVVTDLRYKAGIERIEGAYNTLMKGSRNLKSTLKEMEGFIFELNTANSMYLNIHKLRNYLDMVRKEKGQQAVRDLGSYVVSVKAEYLIMVSLYYAYMKDQERVAQEWTDFNQDAMEIIKYVGLEVDTLDKLKKRIGTMSEDLEMPRPVDKLTARTKENKKTGSERQNSGKGEVNLSVVCNGCGEKPVVGHN